MNRTDGIRKLLMRSSGVTLVETLVALGLLTMTLGLLGSGILQSLSIENFWLDDVVATREARHAGSWLSGDVLNAEEVCDLEAAPDQTLEPDEDAPSLILVWYELEGSASPPADHCTLATSVDYTLHVATYAQSGNDLTRTVETTLPDGTVQTTTQVLSQRVSQVLFQRSASGEVLTMWLDVDAERETIENLRLDTFLRRLRG